MIDLPLLVVWLGCLFMYHTVFFYCINLFHDIKSLRLIALIVYFIFSYSLWFCARRCWTLMSIPLHFNGVGVVIEVCFVDMARELFLFICDSIHMRYKLNYNLYYFVFLFRLDVFILVFIYILYLFSFSDPRLWLALFTPTIRHEYEFASELQSHGSWYVYNTCC